MDEEQLRNPATAHTPEGLDPLLERIRDVRAKAQPRTPPGPTTAGPRIIPYSSPTVMSGSDLRWITFIGAQTPAILGMIFVGAIMVGLVAGDPLGVTAAAGFFATVGGSAISLLANACLDGKTHGGRKGLAIALHLCYLIGWGIFMAYVAMSPPRYHGAGGF